MKRLSWASKAIGFIMLALVLVVLGILYEARTLKAQQPTLFKGSVVKLSLTETIATGHLGRAERRQFHMKKQDAYRIVKTGDLITFAVVEDVVTESGKVMIPKGSTATGTITIASGHKWAARGGKLTFSIDYVKLPSGFNLPLSTQQAKQGSGHQAAMVGGMAAAAVICPIAAPFMLLNHGNETVVKLGSQFSAYTSEDYR